MRVDRVIAPHPLWSLTTHPENPQDPGLLPSDSLQYVIFISPNYFLNGRKVAVLHLCACMKCLEEDLCWRKIIGYFNNSSFVALVLASVWCLLSTLKIKPWKTKVGFCGIYLDDRVLRSRFLSEILWKFKSFVGAHGGREKREYTRGFFFTCMHACMQV